MLFYGLTQIIIPWPQRMAGGCVFFILLINDKILLAKKKPNSIFPPHVVRTHFEDYMKKYMKSEIEIEV